MAPKSGEQGPNSGGGDGGSDGGGGEQGPNSGSRVMDALVSDLKLGLAALGPQPRRSRDKVTVGVVSQRVLSIAARRSDLAGLLEPVTSR